jgi:hypothetical protein
MLDYAKKFRLYARPLGTRRQPYFQGYSGPRNVILNESNVILSEAKNLEPR